MSIPDLPAAEAPSAPPRTHAPGSEKFGELPNAVELVPSAEIGPAQDFKGLFRAPVMRQWFEQGVLYREGVPRQPARVEVFFDLVFIALINRLANAVIEQPAGDAVARFVLTFWPAWSVWFEARRYGNVLGTDDVLHRTWVLVAMMGMLGYIANASAIKLVNDPDDNALRATVAFWLVIKALHVGVIVLVGLRRRSFRLYQFLWAVRELLPMFIYLPLIWVRSRPPQIALASVAMFVDCLPLDGVFFGPVARLLQRAGHCPPPAEPESAGWETDKHLAPRFCTMDRPPPGMRVAAINIEHAVLRMGSFLGLIFGTTIVALVYTAGPGQHGVSERWGKSCLGVMVAFGLNLIYGFPMERTDHFTHALRRSWLTANLFFFLHWPLCASAILMNAAVGRLSNLDTVPRGIAWYWGCGLGFTLLSLAGIAALHRQKTRTRIPRNIRLLFSVVAALALILSPLTTFSSLQWLGLGVGIVWSVVLVNVFGSLPRPQ